MPTPVVRFLSCLAVFALLLLSPLAAHAQADADTAASLQRIEADVSAIEAQRATPMEDVDRILIRGKLATIRQSATAVAEQLEAQLTELDARLAELAPPPEGTPEAPEVTSQRKQLTGERSAIDAEAKRARLLEVEAGQIVTDMQREDAEQFGVRMSQRVESPVMPGFWAGVVASFDEDIGRIQQFLADGQRQAQQEGQKRGVWFALFGALIAAGLVGPGRIIALRLGERRLIGDDPTPRRRRSAYALFRVFIGTMAPLLAAVALVVGAQLSNLTPPNWDSLLKAFIASTGFAAFTAAVLGALLMRSRPSLRIAPLPDSIADRLRPLSWIMASITFLGGMVDAFNAAVGASEAALAATIVVETTGSILLIAGALLAFGRFRAAEADRHEPTAAGAGFGAFALVLWIVVIAASVALIAGFAEFSLLLMTMIVLGIVISAATYLLMNAADDFATAVFNRESRLGRALVRGVGVRGSAIDQFGVLLSGALRLTLAFVALLLLLAPFGAGGGVGSTIEQVISVADGITIGGVSISPGAIFRGAAVLFIGLTLVRAFMAWLDNRYLPATDLDGSGRNSVSLVARYVGIALAVIWALASLGIGVERIALLLSALSVGIGFGLQAITQNFISGLILLAERPIKIGDIIKVGNDEGDVKRISVRSTEIGLPDHSTLIVPNSELITKTVLNKTLSNPLGRVQIQFSVPIDADTDEVERLLLESFVEESAILHEPQPSVFVDSIVDGRTVFNSFAHVVSPRNAYGARSSVLKSFMRKLRAADIEIGTAPQWPGPLFWGQEPPSKPTA
ncbi:DUF3772 domain-containing protein [Altererythrobacter xixiisoli]|uniref:DUF3772 domain-containing protein n=1 Tax=Croceibacterium xixiisoli TaxID=1476466 RepID=A0A6I4TTH1_9SPHN|nr:DUF3772 domain-containing protein [Croceibacterium xixiisoli]MXO97908.1 DUF3772 domain-containing protein [Croceibacterium xixiisoli]